MSDTHTCTKCNNGFVLTRQNHQITDHFFTGFYHERYATFDDNPEVYSQPDSQISDFDKAKLGSRFNVELIICPSKSCSFLEVRIIPIGRSFIDKAPFRYQPISNSIILATELQTVQIIQDLKEAHSILSASPRASIVLARRALHSMIRETFNITSNNKLVEDINSLKSIENPKLIDSSDIDTLHKIRMIGNDGAHGPLDIESQEEVTADDSKLVLDFLLMFLEKWYVYPTMEKQRLESLAVLSKKIRK